MRTVSRLGALLAPLLIALFTPQSLVHAASVQGSSDIDVMFLVDTSVEMQSNDAARTRLQAMQAIIEMTRGRGTQRVGVMGLSRDEAQRVLLPLTVLPEDLAGSRKVIETRLNPILDGIRSNGDGLTILNSFEELGRVYDRAGGHLWVVLLTNGDADPVGARGEEADVAEAARNRAQQLADDAGAMRISRDHFKSAVKELLPLGVPAILAGLGKTTLTVINVGATSEDRSQVLVPLAQREGGKGTEVLDLSDRNIRQVALDAIAQAPFPPLKKGLISRAQSGSLTQRIRIYQGTREARLVLSGAHGNFDARLVPVAGGKELVTASSKSPVKSLWMTSPAPAHGEYELTVENRGGALDLGVNLEFELGLSAVVTAPKGGIQPVGSAVELGFRLNDFKGELVSDAHLLRDGRFTLNWTDPQGNPPQVTWALTGDEPFERSFTHQPGDASEGKRTYGWTLGAGLLPNGSGDFDWNLKPETGSVAVEFSMPRLTFSNASSTGETVVEGSMAAVTFAFSNDYLSGDATHTAMLDLDVDLLGMSEIPVEIRYEAADDSGRTATQVLIDGQPVGSGTTLVFNAQTPGRISLEVTKTGFGPVTTDVGRLTASVASGAPIEATVSMGAHLGTMTLLAILLLLVLLALAYFAMKKMARRKAWLALIDGMNDETVLYFEDDEKGAA